MTKMNISSTSSLKRIWKGIVNKYLLQTVLWSLVTMVLLVAAILWESSTFRTIMEMDFFNNASKNPDLINTLKSYLYIAIVASFTALGALILIQIKLLFKKYIENKYQVISSFENNFFIFKNLLVLDVAKTITYVFCFTNVFTSVVILGYWLIYYLLYLALEKKFANKELLGQAWWKDSKKRSMLIILAIEACYLIGKNIILHVSKQTIDIDQILKYFIPASSLALILAVFIQSLVKNNVKTILANINNVKTKVDNFKMFYNWDYNNANSDFLFIKEAPLIVRNHLKQKVLTEQDRKQIIKLLHDMYDIIIFLEKQNLKDGELRYIYYHLFYEVTSDGEIKKIKNHLLKQELAPPIIQGNNEPQILK